MINIDYRRDNIINLTASILSIYGAFSGVKELDSLNVESLKSSRNIIFIVFDGLGYNLLMNSDAAFLKATVHSRLQTVFPSTTTAAMTTFYTGLTPVEHSMIGWSLYYPEYSLLADVLPKQETATQKKLGEDYYLLGKMPEENIFSKIKRSDKNVDVHFVAPYGIHNTDYTLRATSPAKITSYRNISELPGKLRGILEKGGNSNFIFVYSDLPDSFEHLYGVNSDKVSSVLQNIDKIALDICEVASPDSAIIITADHGLTDVQLDYINDDIELFDLIRLPIFPEARFFSLFLKDARKELSETVIKRYEDRYYILKREEFINKGLLGTVYRPETYDYLGEYIFISSKNSGMKNYFKDGVNFKLAAHHAGLTEDEMYVPLIIPDKCMAKNGAFLLKHDDH